MTSKGGKAFAWASLGAAVLACAGGWAFGLWHRVSWYDEAVHGFTTFALTLVITLLLRGVVLNFARAHVVLFVLVVLGLGLGLGAAWELCEWAYEQLSPGREQVIPSLDDTMIDLLIDGVGALLAGVIAAGMAWRWTADEPPRREGAS